MKAYKVFLEEEHAGRKYLLPCSGHGISIMIGSGYRPPTTKTTRVVKPKVGMFSFFTDKTSANEFIIEYSNMLSSTTQGFRDVVTWEIETVGNVTHHFDLSVFSFGCHGGIYERKLVAVLNDAQLLHTIATYCRKFGPGSGRIGVRLDKIGIETFDQPLGDMPDGTNFCEGFKLIRQVDERK